MSFLPFIAPTNELMDLEVEYNGCKDYRKIGKTLSASHWKNTLSPIVLQKWSNLSLNPQNLEYGKCITAQMAQVL